MLKEKAMGVHESFPGMSMQVFQHGDIELHYAVIGPPNFKTDVYFYSGFHPQYERRAMKALQVGLQRNLQNPQGMLKNIAVNIITHPYSTAHSTDTNLNGVNNNRAYPPNQKLTDPYALANAALVDHLKPKLVVSVHSDWGRKHKDSRFNGHRNPWDGKPNEGIYIYDGGNKRIYVPFSEIFSEVQNTGIDLFTGYDDPDDPVLAYWFEDGYCYIPTYKLKKEPTFEGWMMRHNNSNSKKGRRILTVELPGQASGEIQDDIMTILVKHFVYRRI